MSDEKLFFENSPWGKEGELVPNNQEWEEMPEFPEYLVREDGVVKFLGRIRSDGTKVPSKILRVKKESNGYLRVSIRSVLWSVHKVVAHTYLENPEGLPQINHIDCNKENNHWSNLEWVTPAKNIKHAFDAGRFDSLSGEKSHLSRYSEQEILEVVRLLKTGLTPSQVARQVKISRPVCSKINNGVTWNRFLVARGILFPINKTGTQC